MAKLDIALIHELCPVYLTPVNEQILLGKTIITRDRIGILEKNLHGKPIAISKELSENAKKEIGDGVFLIEIDPKRSEDMRNPFRTGNIIGISKDAFLRWFNVPFPVNNWTYVEFPIVTQILEQNEAQSNNL